MDTCMLNHWLEWDKWVLTNFDHNRQWFNTLISPSLEAVFHAWVDPWGYVIPRWTSIVAIDRAVRVRRWNKYNSSIYTRVVCIRWHVYMQAMWCLWGAAGCSSCATITRRDDVLRGMGMSAFEEGKLPRTAMCGFYAKTSEDKRVGSCRSVSLSYSRTPGRTRCLEWANTDPSLFHPSHFAISILA